MTTSAKKLAKLAKKAQKHARREYGVHGGAAQRVSGNQVVRLERALRTHSLAHVVISEFDQVPDFPYYSLLLDSVAHHMIRMHGRKACEEDATFLALTRELQTGELYLGSRLHRPHCASCFLREVHAIADYREIHNFDLVDALVRGPGNRDAHGQHTGKAAYPAWVVARTAVRHVHALLQKGAIGTDLVAQIFQSDNVEHTARILDAFHQL